MQYRTLEVGETLIVGDMVIGSYELFPVIKGGEKCVDNNLLRPIEPTESKADDLADGAFDVSVKVGQQFEALYPDRTYLQKQFTKLSNNYADLAGKYLELLKKRDY